jgi:hemolysin III
MAIINAMMNAIKRDQSINEEIANSLSHGVGLIAAIAGTPFLIMQAAKFENVNFIVGASVFSATMILLYSSSMVYHFLPTGKLKSVFNIFDHSMIFLLIAGTYTPFTLGVLHGAWGWTLFGIVWGLALIGVLLKAFKKASNPMFSNSLYLLMGWIVLVAIRPLTEKMDNNGLLWLLIGGMFYTIGIVFYITDSKIKFGHFIWHLFVIAGTVCHYFAVLWYSQ